MIVYCCSESNDLSSKSGVDIVVGTHTANITSAQKKISTDGHNYLTTKILDSFCFKY